MLTRPVIVRASLLAGFVLLVLLFALPHVEGSWSLHPGTSVRPSPTLPPGAVSQIRQEVLSHPDLYDERSMVSVTPAKGKTITIQEIRLSTWKQVTALSTGSSISEPAGKNLEPVDAPVYVAELSGMFLMAPLYSVPPSFWLRIPFASTLYEVFDAHTVHLLFWATGPLVGYVSPAGTLVP